MNNHNMLSFSEKYADSFVNYHSLTIRRSCNELYCSAVQYLICKNDALIERVHDKINNLVSDQVRHELGCTVRKDG